MCKALQDSEGGLLRGGLPRPQGIVIDSLMCIQEISHSSNPKVLYINTCRCFQLILHLPARTTAMMSRIISFKCFFLQDCKGAVAYLHTYHSSAALQNIGPVPDNQGSPYASSLSHNVAQTRPDIMMAPNTSYPAEYFSKYAF